MARTKDNTLVGKKTYPKLEALRRDVDVGAVLDKTVSPRENHTRWGGKNHELSPSGSLLQTVSNLTTRNVNDVSNILQLLPDTELAIQILVASILSPKDLVTTELGYRVDNTALPSDVTAPLLEVVRTYFEESYKIQSYLPTMLEDVLFRQGAYPMLVLPESSIDRIINSTDHVSLEDARDDLDLDGGRPRPSIGILGTPKEKRVSWSLENFASTPEGFTKAESVISTTPEVIRNLVTVTDNPVSLKYPQFLDKMRRDRLDSVLSHRGFGTGMEARKPKRGEVTDQEVRHSVFRNRQYQPQTTVSIPSPRTANRESVGHPLVIKLPTESVIPVHVPSNPGDHIGYFVLLDQNGNPLARAHESDYYNDLSNNLGSTTGKDFTSQLLHQAQGATQGFNRTHNQKMEVDEAVRLYTEIVERDLVTRLKNGIYGDDVEISRPQEIYRVMLSRALAQKHTQLLYVPAELMNYIAFDYNRYGVGKSLLEDNKILAGIRAMLLFSNTMAAIKNSVGRTGLKIQLDPQDPDPSSTVEFLIHEYAKNTRNAYPLGASNPNDIINFLQNAAIDVNVTGNAAYPETTMDVEDNSSQKVAVDTELEDKIRERYFMSLGISPETIDLSKNVEFATSIVSSNLLLAKRVIVYQDKFTPHLEDFIQKFVLNSGSLMESLRQKLDSVKDSIPKEYEGDNEALLLDFIYSIVVTLPRPDTVTLENQMEAFRNYSEALEMALDAYFSEDIMAFSEFDDLEMDVRPTRSALEAHFKREWLRNNNVMPELMDLITVDEKDQAMLDLLDTHTNHLKAIGNALAKYMDELRKARKKREEKYQEAEETEEGGSTSGFDGGYGDTFGTEPEEGGEEEPTDGEVDEGGEEAEETEETEEPEEEPSDEGGDDEEENPTI